MLDWVFFLGFGARNSFAAPALSPIRTDGSALDVAIVANENDHRFLFDQVLQIDLADFLAADFRATLVAIFAFEFLAIGADNRQDVLLVGQNSLMLGDFV